MPTYKQTKRRNEKGLIFNISSSEWRTLNARLMENDARIIVKMHPLEVDSISMTLSNYSNISLVTDLDLISRNIQLYSLIGGMDGLITDYSSVCFDYLLLNRPMAFTQDDLEGYQRDRGIIFDKKQLSEIMPGETVTNFKDLMSFCDNICHGRDDFFEARTKANSTVNDGSGVEDFCFKILERVEIRN
jgi:CDP-glycerol glycerophosphotransferase (TagB/SpsB family)